MAATPLNPTNAPGLKTLADELKDFHILPITANNQKLVQRALRRPQANAESVSRIIKQDPALTLRIIFSANQTLLKQDNEVHRLAHAISLLGLPQTEVIVAQAPTYKGNSGYNDALQQALICADISSHIQLFNSAEQEGYYLSGLALNYLSQALWCRYPQLMKQRDSLLANPDNKFFQDEIDVSIFGVTLTELNHQLSKLWPLPTLSKAALAIDNTLIIRLHSTFTQKKSGQLQSLRDDITQSLQNKTGQLRLCDHLAEHGCNGWYTSDTFTSQRILASATSLPLNKIISHCRQACIVNSLNDSPYFQPAAKLLQFWDKSVATEHNSLKENNSHTESSLSNIGSSKQNMPLNETLLQKNLARLQSENAFENLNQLFNTAMETLRTGLGVKQIALLIVNKTRTELKTRYQYGLDTSHPLRHAKIELDNTGVIAKLLQQPAGLYITTENYRSVTKQLPTAMATHIQAGKTALMSIFNQQQPIAIFYISDDQLNPINFQLFKKICSATGKAIHTLAKHKNSKI
jgi:hypothetical protein